MVSPRLLLLEQSDFLSNYVGSFQELRTARELFDVTLACEDETVEAHKVVISACSQFFRHVLTKATQNHPFIYLKGVLYKDLVALLDYIYTGETQIPAQDVNRLIEAARELQIKGLAEDELSAPENKNPYIAEEKHEQEQYNENLTEINQVESSLLDDSSESEEVEYSYQNVTISESEVELENGEKSAKVIAKSGSTSTGKSCGGKYKKKVKAAEPFEDEQIKVEVAVPLEDEQIKVEVKDAIDHFESGDEKDQNEKLRTEILKRMDKFKDPKEGRMWKCTVCGKIKKKKSNLEMHVETHLEGFTHRCVHCDITRKTRGSLQLHMFKSHRGTK